MLFDERCLNIKMKFQGNMESVLHQKPLFFCRHRFVAKTFRAFFVNKKKNHKSTLHSA